MCCIFLHENLWFLVYIYNCTSYIFFFSLFPKVRNKRKNKVSAPSEIFFCKQLLGEGGVSYLDLTSDVVIGEEGRGGVYKTQVQVGVGRVERREERVGILDLVGI